MMPRTGPLSRHPKMDTEVTETIDIADFNIVTADTEFPNTVCEAIAALLINAVPEEDGGEETREEPAGGCQFS